jgi:type I restriction enzyme S subunit
VEKKLEDVCKFGSGGTPSKKNSDYWNGDIPWVSGRDMKSTRLSDATLHISQKAVDQSSTRMASTGELLALVRGMGLAHGAQIAEVMVPCAFNQDIRSIQPDPDLIPRYLLFALRTRIDLSENVLSNAAHGTLKIDMNEFRNVKIPIPSREQQRQVVLVIDNLCKATKRLEATYQQKLTGLAELKQSILQKAFSGELTQKAA